MNTRTTTHRLVLHKFEATQRENKKAMSRNPPPDRPGSGEQVG